VDRQTESRVPDAWRVERAKGMVGIAVAVLASVALWYAIRFHAPLLDGMDEPVARLAFALKCAALAVLFTLVLGIEAVAHERLVSPAFDPLAGHETRRLRVNQRYLQNTLEQTVVFLVGLLGLAVYMEDGNQMRAVTATAVVWVLGRWAFWAGYHLSSTWRVLGAPSMLLGQLVLGYVGLRVGYDVAGAAGAGAVLAVFLLFEALLFWKTATPPSPNSSP
jgi:hypothetical protein